MPRQDVPYGGAICRLRERIAEIFDKLGEKLHTINGVPGDGDGNVKIVSGSSAVVITNDPTQNEIAVSLDTSQLPAAAVSSVNGQTGAVALTADDVPSDNGDVQTDLDNLAAADVTLQGNINAEALARQNADSTLQTNINAVLASIPDMSVTPDPYKGIERDAQGRAFATDPASGATDKSLTTANWISQTGAGAPNNLLHRNGDETASGVKTYSDRIVGTSLLSYSIGVYGYTGWYKALDLGATANYIQTKLTIFTASYRTPTQYAELFINNNRTPQIVAIISKGTDTTHADPANYGVMVENNHVIFYMKKLNSDMSMAVNVEYKTSYGAYINAGVTVIGEQVSDPSSLTGFIPATLLIG